MRKIERSDVVMAENLAKMLRSRAVFRDPTGEECSAIHQTRVWVDGLHREFLNEVQVADALAGAKCIDPGPDSPKGEVKAE